jgi:hypothetical protein
MVSTRHLLDHIDALVRISHDIPDRAISAKLREMADELRILVSVADVAALASTLGAAPALARPAPNEMVAALYEGRPKRKRKAKEKAEEDAPRPKPKRKSKKRAGGG